MGRAKNRSVYNIPRSAGDPVHVAWKAVGMFLVGSIIALWLDTEFCALQFHFQPALGKPLSPQVYAPWQIISWLYRFSSLPDARIRNIMANCRVVIIGLEAITLLAALASVMRHSSTRNKSDLHGSAHWAAEAEIRRMGLLSGRGVYVGAWKTAAGGVKYLRHDGPEHVLAFAPTRSGKGVGLVIPSLLSWPGSSIIHDIKGENFMLTAGWRAKHLGHRVLKFDPANNDGTSCLYNPLEHIRLGTDHEIQDIQNIVQMLVDPDGRGADGHEAHWIASASALLVGVILHVMYTGSERSLAGVGDFLSSAEFANPAAMYTSMATATHGRGTHPAVAAAARDMLNKDPREAASVLSTAIRFLTLFRDPIIAANTGKSDFKIADFRTGSLPLTLYIVVSPADIDRLRPLTRLLFNQILRELTSAQYLESAAGGMHRVLLMIDELPSLGRLEILQTSLAFMAGYGLKAYLITQDISQLNSAYGGSSGRDETIMANCHVQVAFAANRVETMEAISKLLGSATVRTESRSYSGARIGFKSHVMVNTQDTERALLTPDEVRRLPDDDQLIFVSGHAPIYCNKIRYYRDATFKDRASLPPPVTSSAVAAVRTA